MCFQYTDFSTTVIGSFVPVLSDGEFRKRSLPQPSRHPFSRAPLLSRLPGQQNEKLQTDRWTGSGGQVKTGRSTFRSFLLITIWHTGRGKQSAQHPILPFLPHQHFITASFICKWYRDTRVTEDKNIPQRSNQSLPTLYVPCTNLGCAVCSSQQLIQNQTEIETCFNVKRSSACVCWWLGQVEESGVALSTWTQLSDQESGSGFFWL